ncbi:MAG: phosphatase PAP2-related protein [Patescibacteria group bacterium]
MKYIFKNLLNKYKKLFAERDYVIRVLAYLVFFIISIFATYLSISYIDQYYTGYTIPDIILDNIPTLNLAYLFFQGAFVFGITTIAIFTLFPEYIPFGLATGALFFTTRSGFMILTHLSAPFIAHYSFVEDETQQAVFTLSSGNDQFFSGHTGFPFLLALIFWKHKRLRYFFLICSVIAAAVVLLGHFHYSIDVFSAYFITYGIFVIAQHTFKKEQQLI